MTGLHDGPDPVESHENPSMTPLEVKQLTQELLKTGSLGSAASAARFEAVMRRRPEIQAALEPLDLELELDELRGIALLRVARSAAADPDEEWSHPLVRRQRLTLEQSLLVAILRQFYVVQEQESGIGVRAVHVPLEDLLGQINVFLGDTGSDTRNRQRLLTLLEQLKPHGIVSEPSAQGDIMVRPLITKLANPETLASLVRHFRDLVNETSTSSANQDD